MRGKAIVPFTDESYRQMIEGTVSGKLGKWCEIVVYRIKAGVHEAFCNAHDIICSQLKEQKGFIEHYRYANAEKPSEYVDVVHWQTFDDIVCSRSKFRELKGADEFMAYIESVEKQGIYQMDGRVS